MFSGIIKELGIIKKTSNINGNIRFYVWTNKILNKLSIGGSIAINGICQTIINIEDNIFTFEAIKETQNKTTIRFLRSSDRVNLENAAKFGEENSGHYVTGHIDGIGKIRNIAKNNGSKNFYINIPQDLLKFLSVKGSIAVNGVSLTIAEINKNVIRIAAIPHTLENTNLGKLIIGNLVNIETDLIAKYTYNALKDKCSAGIDFKLLAQNGFI